MADKNITLKRKTSSGTDNLYPSTTWGQIDSSTIPSTFTPTSHTHGNINDDGRINTSSIIATGDHLIIADHSSSNDLTGSSITFDTSNSTDFLRKDGTFATPAGTTFNGGTITSDLTVSRVNANGNISATRVSGATVNMQGQSARGVVGTDSNHELQLKTNATARVTIQTDGDVGIGTTSPTSKLDVNGALNLKNKVFGDSDGTNSYLKAGTSGRIYFETNGGTRGGIDASGNFGVGILSPQTKLHIVGPDSDGSAATVRIGGPSDGTGNNTSRLELAEATTNSNADMHYGFSFTADGSSTNNFLLRSHNNSTTGVIGLSQSRATGNVGIKTSGPGSAYALDVNGDVRGNRYYDRNDTNYYVDPASTSVINALNVNRLEVEGAIFDVETDQLRMPLPKGGYYTNGSSSVTGAIEITLPSGTHGNYTMISFFVDVFDYNGGADGESFTMHLGGYVNGSTWTHTFANMVTVGRTDRFFNVRYNVDGTANKIYIGETTNNWSYPKIQIRDLMAGHSGADDADWYNNAFTIDITTTMDGTTARQKTLESVATWADQVDVNSSSSTSYYNVIWHSGDTIYYAANNKLRVQPSTGNLQIDGDNVETEEFASTYTTISSSGWNDYALGRGIFSRSDSSGLPSGGTHGYWLTLGRRDVSGGYAGIYVNNYSTAGSGVYIGRNDSGGSPTWEKVWTDKTDGASSGLDADLLDGQQGSYYTGYTDTAIANLVDSSPGTLDTLNELAAALGDDANFSTTVTNSIATKLPLAGGTMTGDIKFTNATDIGIENASGNSWYRPEDQYGNTHIEVRSGKGIYVDADTVAFRSQANTDRMRITSAGNVGIGDTNPSEKLTVNGKIRANDNFQHTGTGGYYLYNSSMGFRGAFYDNGTTTAIYGDGNGSTPVIHINSDKVGIGADNPGSKLQVNSTGTALGRFFSTGNGDTHGLYINVNVTASDVALDNNVHFASSGSNSGSFTFATGNDERMRIQSNGRIGIGTTSPLSTLDVRSDDGLYITTATNAPSNGAQIRFSDHSSQAQYGFIKYKHANQTVETEPVNSDDGFIIGGSETNTVVSIQGSLNVDGQTNFENQVEVDSGDLIVRSGTVSANSFRSVLRDNSLENQATNGNADIGINYYGYAGGTTQFRDLNIYDGKTNLIATFDGSTNRLGIGTNTPGEKLHIVGNQIIEKTTTGGQNQIQFKEAGTTKTQLTSNYGDNKFYLYHEGDNVMTIDSSSVTTFSSTVNASYGRLSSVESNGSDVDKVNFSLSGTTLTITTS